MSESMHLYIHLDDLSEDSSTAGSSSNKKNSSEKDTLGLKSAAKKIVSYAAVKATAEKLWDAHVSQVELSTGAAEYEARLSAKTQVARQIWNAGEAIVMGAAFGGVAGAIAGLAISGFNYGINYAISADRLRKEKALEDISIGMKNIRAGTAGRRSREQ